jgi:hypothetical protein
MKLLSKQQFTDARVTSIALCSVHVGVRLVASAVVERSRIIINLQLHPDQCCSLPKQRELSLLCMPTVILLGNSILEEARPKLRAEFRKGGCEGKTTKYSRLLKLVGHAVV